MQGDLMADIICIAVKNGDMIVTIRNNGGQPEVDTMLSHEDAEMLARKLIRELVIWEEEPW